MANYTINNLPNVADDVVNTDKLPIWKTDEEKTAQVPVSTLMAGTKVVFASSTTVTGNTLASGDVLRIMFTSAITGSDTTTGLTITYNGTPYAVKVCKQGALADFVATEIDSSYYYLQAYTTLEMAFNGGAFVIIGNPVVLSSDDYTIYADGSNAEVKIAEYPFSITVGAGLNVTGSLGNLPSGLKILGVYVNLTTTSVLSTAVSPVLYNSTQVHLSIYADSGASVAGVVYVKYI